MSTDAPEAAPDTARPERATRRAVGLVLAITLLVFLPAIVVAGFVWDDLLLIRDNPALVGPHAWREVWTKPFWNVPGFMERANYYRPLCTLVFTFERRVLGTFAPAQHALVVAAHLLAVALFARFLRRVLGPRPLPVATGTLLFALHATRHQSVIWLVGLTDVLLAVWVFASWLVALPREGEPLPGPGRVLALTALSLLAGLSKETAILLPVSLVVVVLATWKPAQRKGALLRTALPSALVAAALVLSRYAFLAHHETIERPPLARALTVGFETLARFFAATLWPWPLVGITAIVPYEPLAGLRVLVGWSLAGLAVFVIATALVLRARRHALESAGLALAGLFLAPVCNFVWLGLPDLAPHRFLYLPLAGLGLTVASLVARLDPRWHRAVALSLVAFVCAHGYTLALKAFDYRDDLTFWHVENDHLPDQPDILRNLAAAEGAAEHPGRQLQYARAQLRLMNGHAVDEIRERAVFRILEAMQELVPDRDEPSLLALVSFFRELQTPSVARPTLVLHGVRLALPRAHASEVARTQAHLTTTEALLQSRLGHDAEARALAEQDARECRERCAGSHMAAATVCARARDFPCAAAHARAALAEDPDGRLPRNMLDLARRAPRERARAQAAGPVALALFDAELDLLLGAPQRAAARLEGLPDTGYVQLDRIQLALLDYDFATADTLLAALEPSAPPQVLPRIAALHRLRERRYERLRGAEHWLATAPP